MKSWIDSKILIRVIVILFLSSMTAVYAHASTDLIAAACEGQAAVVKDLLDKGADVNERGRTSFLGEPGWSPLLCAVKKGHMETVKVLVERGADVNACTGTDWNVRTKTEWTPLMIAVNHGYTNIAKFLIEKGADVDFAIDRFEIKGRKEGIKFLEKFTKKQQPSNAQILPQTLPTALPIPTETAAPF